MTGSRSGMVVASPDTRVLGLRLFSHKSNDDIDVRNPEVLRRFRQSVDPDRTAGNVEQLSICFHIEMIVVGDIGIEVCPLSANGDLAQQSRALKLVERVVDGCEGDPLARSHGLFVQDLRRYVAIAIAKQQRRQGNALASRPQAGPPEETRNVNRPRGFGVHIRISH